MDYLKKVKKRYEKVSCFRAKFIQISMAPGVGKPEKARGIVYLRKDGKFRWDYDTPDVTLIVSDGKTLWIYEPEDRQVIVDRNFTKRLKKFPYTFLNGIGHLDRDFKTMIENEQPQTVTLKLYPKKEIKGIKVMRVSFSTKTFLIHEVSWTSPQGVKTVIVFNDIDITSKIPDSVFQFEPPPGVDIVNAQTP
jgi:outer membrane lipoprotein carrier protein